MTVKPPNSALLKQMHKLDGQIWRSLVVAIYEGGVPIVTMPFINELEVFPQNSGSENECLCIDA